MSPIEQHIVHIENQLRINSILKSLLVAIGSGLLFYSFQDSLAVALSVAGISFFIASYFFGLFKNQKTVALQILHERIPSLEFSLELLNKKERNLAESLQWERINLQVPEEKPSIFKENLQVAFYFFLISIAVFALSFIDFTSGSDLLSPNEELKNTISVTEEQVPIELSDLSVRIVPPAYTELPGIDQNTMEIKAIKGSKIRWETTFSGTDDLTVMLVNSQGEELIFEKKSNQYFLQEEAVGSGIYAIRAFEGEHKVFETSYYTLEVTEDQAPLIQPTEKDVYKFHFQKDPQKMGIEARVSDDFKVGEVYLVATLARGSGENVKFRENRIEINERNFKSSSVKTVLDFEDLEFKQGDELYYYWAAKDNKRPEANFSRSDTYFIKYVDSTGIGEAEMAGMAISVLPEYFRSQRQIIIDTEKLISQRKTMEEHTFNETSNNIGYDQKLLRLRYGQYLGEEFENSAGGGSMEADDGDILAGYRHAHDEEEEHEPVGPPIEQHEGHGEESGSEVEYKNEDESGLGNLLSAFMHNHESEEVNTYYEESTKSALKMALEQMWESELYLRLYEPETALPFEKKALEYLKSVQQKSRVYVKRTGFDPPPIKEAEKRLSGELDDIEKLIQKEQIILEERIRPLASRVLGLVSRNEFSSVDQAAISELGKLWTARMQYSGLEDWSVLLALQQLTAGELSKESRAELVKALYPVANSGSKLAASYLQEKELEKAFWKNIK
ncbi:hypothetical protein JYB64_12095 [Algoriphagus aestuarii]|nr:hypothetical protein [Algoriphagus aestuarii]